MSELITFISEEFRDVITLLRSPATMFFAVATGTFLSMSATFSLYFVYDWFLTRRQEAPKSIVQKITSTLSALEDNSKQATQLLSQLQAEIFSRTKAVEDVETALHKLQEQRTLLELTNEQRKAIESLVRRAPSPREIFSSLDFWLGRVLVSAIFFIAGVTITLLLRR